MSRRGIDTNLYEIQQAITELSPPDLNRFRAWFEESDAQMWDRQIEEDAKSGRLDKIIAEVDAEYDAGLSKPL